MYIDSDKLKQWLVESLGYGHDNVYKEVINKVAMKKPSPTDRKRPKEERLNI